MKEKISTKIVRTIQSSIITIDALRRKIHILFFYLKKKKKRENKIPSIPSLLPPTLVESKIFTFYKSSGDNRMKRNEEERGKLKRREREKSNSRKSSRFAKQASLLLHPSAREVYFERCVAEAFPKRPKMRERVDDRAKTKYNIPVLCRMRGDLLGFSRRSRYIL